MFKVSLPVRAGSIGFVSAALFTLAAFSTQPASAEVEWRSGARSAPSRMQPAELDTAIKLPVARPLDLHLIKPARFPYH